MDVSDVCVCTRFRVRTFPASRDISDGPVSDGSVGHDPLTQIRELDADTERHE